MWLLIAHPTEFPGGATYRRKGIQGVRREEARSSGPAGAPRPVDKNFSLAGERREEIGGRLLRSHDPRRHGCFHDTSVNDLILIQRGTDRKTLDPWAWLHVQGFHATATCSGGMNRHVVQGRFAWPNALIIRVYHSVSELISGGEVWAALSRARLKVPDKKVFQPSPTIRGAQLAVATARDHEILEVFVCFDQGVDDLIGAGGIDVAVEFADDKEQLALEATSLHGV
jgi:hypothetical protein